jgi:hypothetical protein
MRSASMFRLVVAVALLFCSGIGVAAATDPMLLAVNGGFLLGNAYRCGVSTDRVKRAGEIIQDFIVAAAYSSKEEAAADAQFADSFVAGAFPSEDPNALIPSCEVVVTQFDRVERHHQQAGLN